jgi:hypothetical protein
VLAAVRTVALRGDDEPATVAEREPWQRVLAEPNPYEAIELEVEHLAELWSRWAELKQVLRGAASSGEPVLRELWATGEPSRHGGSSPQFLILRPEHTSRDVVVARRARLRERLAVRWTETRLDCELASGVAPDARASLALRAQALGEPRTRRALAVQLHRLERYRAGRRMDFDESTPAVIAGAIAEEIGRDVDYAEVESDGALNAARRIAELLN